MTFARSRRSAVAVLLLSGFTVGASAAAGTLVTGPKVGLADPLPPANASPSPAPAGAAATRAAVPVAAGLDIDALNFAYTIKGDAPWKPLRAFDDGTHVYIEFDGSIAQGEMPPLFVVGADGKTAELVNYRVQGHRLIVDRLFAVAELRLGAKHQQKVRITRTGGARS